MASDSVTSSANNCRTRRTSNVTAAAKDCATFAVALVVVAVRERILVIRKAIRAAFERILQLVRIVQAFTNGNLVIVLDAEQSAVGRYAEHVSNVERPVLTASRVSRSVADITERVDGVVSAWEQVRLVRVVCLGRQVLVIDRRTDVQRNRRGVGKPFRILHVVDARQPVICRASLIRRVHPYRLGMLNKRFRDWFAVAVTRIFFSKQFVKHLWVIREPGGFPRFVEMVDAIDVILVENQPLASACDRKSLAGTSGHGRTDQRIQYTSGVPRQHVELLCQFV